MPAASACIHLIDDMHLHVLKAWNARIKITLTGRIEKSVFGCQSGAQSWDGARERVEGKASDAVGNECRCECVCVLGNVCVCVCVGLKRVTEQGHKTRGRIQQ